MVGFLILQDLQTMRSVQPPEASRLTYTSGKSEQRDTSVLFLKNRMVWLHWFQTEIAIYVSLWENDPTSCLICYLGNIS